LHFSTEFALKLMGDVQGYFIDQKVRNFYSVSISGYHIAEAGANPITQLAFTLANGFTYVEYYLSRGMHIDDFAPNLSFFFSNGMDAEYSVIGRVARRIWAKAMKNKYHGNERSQKLKYHIQTSGRSLHAQEIDFNDIRTTLQALYAIYDNCNSLHTNAYDEAITTPTEESVRRAMAIQLIINRELGTAKNENPNQGSFLMEELTDLVEEAVLVEFDRLTDRGGVLGAMERMYQRNKIQEESLQYETLKHTGELPIVGVNTFLNKKGSPTILPGEVIRSTTEEKEQQIQNLLQFHGRNANKNAHALKQLKKAAIQNENLFTELMETVKYCSLGQITHALYEVGASIGEICKPCCMIFKKSYLDARFKISNMLLRRFLLVVAIGFLSLSQLSAQFRKIDTTMKVGKAGYRVYCNNKSPEKNNLSITPQGFEAGSREISLEIKGRILGAETDDLNNDGFPDLVLWVYNSDPNSYGKVFGIYSDQNKGIRPIVFQTSWMIQN